MKEEGELRRLNRQVGEVPREAGERVCVLIHSGLFPVVRGC